MVKATKNYQRSSSQKNGNRKLTDFFPRSSNEPSSSQPRASQGQARLFTTNSSATTIKVEPAKSVPISTSSPIRGPKKENKPPRIDQEIISVSSRSDSTATHITISSDNSVISISSTFSSPPPVPIAIVDASNKFDTNHFSSYGRGASKSEEVMDQSSTLRRSPRLRSNSDKQKFTSSSKAPVFKKLTAASTIIQAIEDVPYKGPKRKAPIEEDLLSSSGTVTSRNRPVTKSEHVAGNETLLQKGSENKAPSPIKKAKFMCDNSEDSDLSKVIPSSQSDEREVTLPKPLYKDQDQIRENIEAWKKNNLDPESMGESWSLVFDPQQNIDSDIIMNVDVGEFKEEDSDPIVEVHTPVAFPIETEFSMGKYDNITRSDLPATPAISTSLSSTITSSSRPLTPLPENMLSTLQIVSAASIDASRHTPPPISNSPKLASLSSSLACVSASSPPVTPKFLDEKTKTQLIIEEIKRNAFASASSSPMDEERSYGELMDLSDPNDSDEDVELEYKPMFSKASKGKGKNIDVSPLTDLESSTIAEESEVSEKHYATRRSRRHSSSKATNKNVFHEPPFKLTIRGPKGVPKQTKSDINPFDALLKEKADDEARGISSFALLQDEATKAAIDFANGLGLRSSPSANGSSDDGDLNNIVGPSDRTRLLGSPGRAIDKIIQSDQMQSANIKTEESVGLPIWICAEGVETQSCTDPPRLLDNSEYLIIKKLRNHTAKKDITAINSILESGLLATNMHNFSEHLITWLFGLVTLGHSLLSDNSYKTLLHRNTSKANCNLIALPFEALQNAMLCLGMRTDVMELLDLPISAHIHVILEPEERSIALFRLVGIIKSFAKTKQLKIDDLSLFIAILLCVAIDPDTKESLRNDIAYTIERLFTEFYPLTSTRTTEEIKLCRTILMLKKVLTPESKALLLSCLVGGSTIGLRVAQWVGFGLLAEESVEDNSIVPPLSTIISMLTHRGGVFEICRENGTDETDYSALASHVEILGFVLRNMVIYVKLEKEEKKAMRSGQSDTSTSFVCSPPSTPSRKHAQGSKTSLEILHQVLDKLSNSIVDTRAAHPERSKVKAALQHLDHRVHYERQAILKSSGRKSQNLEMWMKKKPRPMQRHDSFST